MPKTLSNIELDDMQQVTKAFLLVSEARYLINQAELSYQEFFEHVDDICKAFYQHTLDDEANYLLKQIDETGRSIRSLKRVFLLD